MKKLIRNLVLMSVFIVLISCGQSEQSYLYLLEDELALYNGKDGNQAFISVDGIIYDVTDYPNWLDGENEAQYHGKDITEEIETLTPEGRAILDDLPIVGELLDFDFDDENNGDSETDPNGDGDGDLEF